MKGAAETNGTSRFELSRLIERSDALLFLSFPLSLNPPESKSINRPQLGGFRQTLPPGSRAAFRAAEAEHGCWDCVTKYRNSFFFFASSSQLIVASRTELLAGSSGEMVGSPRVTEGPWWLRALILSLQVVW